MDRTFNNGLGMILVVGKKQADAVVHAIAKRIGERVFRDRRNSLEVRGAQRSAPER